jgi:MFS family permease
MPFLILFAKENFSAGNEAVRTFLIFKVTGGVIIGSFLFYYSRRLRYQNLLYLTSFLAFLVPVYVLIIPTFNIYFLSFLGTGFAYTLHKVAIEGVLLEVSNSKNRALYTGLSGAGSVLPAVFPLLGGWLIDQFGFPLFFGLFMGIMLSSVYFIYKLNCQK